MNRERWSVVVLSATVIVTSTEVGWGADSPEVEAPLVDAYGTECEQPWIGELGSQILDQLNARRRGRGHADLIVDPALTLAAAAHVAQFRNGARPQPFADGVGSVRYWLDAAGVTTQFARSACAEVEASTEPAGILSALKPSLDTIGMTHVGIGCRHEGDRVLATVVAAAQYLSLASPVPRVDPGRACRLVGQFRDPVQGYCVVLTRPDGTTVRVARADRQRMAVTVPVGGDVGRYVIELVGLTDGGPLMTDVLKLHVGTPWPKPSQQTIAGPLKADSESEANALVAAVNKLRAAQAMAPLKRDRQLMQIGEYNSGGLRKRQASDPNGKVAHVYIRSLVRYRTYRVDGVVGQRSPEAGEVRGALSSAFTHIGVGMARGKLGGKDTVWTTVILMAK